MNLADEAHPCFMIFKGIPAQELLRYVRLSLYFLSKELVLLVESNLRCVFLFSGRPRKFHKTSLLQRIS